MTAPLINPARARIMSELTAEARREWGAQIEGLPRETLAEMLLALACDRIDAGETRGFARRGPTKLVHLREHKLKPSTLV